MGDTSAVRIRDLGGAIRASAFHSPPPPPTFLPTYLPKMIFRPTLEGCLQILAHFFINFPSLPSLDFVLLICLLMLACASISFSFFFSKCVASAAILAATPAVVCLRPQSSCSMSRFVLSKISSSVHVVPSYCVLCWENNEHSTY